MINFKSILQRKPPQQPAPPSLAAQRKHVLEMLHVIQNMPDYEGHSGASRQRFDKMDPHSFSDADIERIYAGIYSDIKDFKIDLLKRLKQIGWVKVNDKTGIIYRNGNMTVKQNPDTKLCTIFDGANIKKANLGFIQMVDYLTGPVTLAPGTLK